MSVDVASVLSSSGAAASKLSSPEVKARALDPDILDLGNLLLIESEGGDEDRLKDADKREQAIKERARDSAQVNDSQMLHLS